MSTAINKVRISYQTFFPFSNVIDSGNFGFFNDLNLYSDTFLQMVNNQAPNWKRAEMYWNFWKRYVNKNIYNPRKTLPQNPILHIIPAFLPTIHSLNKDLSNFSYSVNSHCFVYPCSLCINNDIDINFQSTLISKATEIISQIIYREDYFLNDKAYKIGKFSEKLFRNFSREHSIPLEIQKSNVDRFISISFLDGKYPYQEAIPYENDLHSNLSEIFKRISSSHDDKLLDIETYQKDSPADQECDFPGNLLIENLSSRIVFLSSNFSDNEYNGKAPNLCFHNNLNMLTIQIKSLLYIIRLAHDYYVDTEVKNIPGILDFYNKSACISLHDLYHRKPNTYRSKSSCRLIPEQDIDIIDKFLHKRYLLRMG